MGLYCPFLIARCVLQGTGVPYAIIIINPFLPRLAQSRWLDIGKDLLLHINEPRLPPVHEQAKKRSRSIPSHLDLMLCQ